MHPRCGRRVVFLLLLALFCADAVGRPGAPGSGPAAGKFLVARREMRDPNFAKTVVLLLDYGAEGALGLVINRPSHLQVSSLSSEIEELASRTDPIYVGGPVPAESLFVVFSADEPPGDSEAVFDRVHVTRSAEVLRSLAGGDEPGVFRVIAGYAGWGPAQLDNEIARGDWHVIEADEGSVFTNAPDEVWEALVPPEPTRQVRFHVPRYEIIARSKY
jgi:putative transcriptional regulator